MKHRLLLPLMVCVLALAGCYRQAEEEFQQVNSSEVEQIDSAVPAVTAIQMSESGVVAPEGEAPTPASGFITPEPPPGQVVQLTSIVSTSIVVSAATPGEAPTRDIFTLPTPTETFEETLDPEDECVYSVLPGDNLFRLSLVFDTTVEAFFEENNLESDALQIGQLLLIPGCEPTEPEAPAAEPVADATAGPVDIEAAPEEAPVLISDPSEGTTLQLPAGPRIHVVSAGETWSSIALYYELGVDQILAANELSSDDQLFVGQELVIPESEEDSAPVNELEDDSPAETVAEETTPEGPNTQEVQDAESTPTEP